MNWDTHGSSQERKMREDVVKVLKANYICRNEDLFHAMGVLDEIGVRAAVHFKLLSVKFLTKYNMPLVAARMLMREFGPGSERTSEEAEASQQRKLRDDVRKALAENWIYGDEELWKAMDVLQELGVKDMEHLKQFTAEQFISEGMPTVTAHILNNFEPKAASDTEDRATPNERKLRDQISEVLEANDIDGEEELRNVMDVLKILGAKSTKHFKHFTTEDLVSKGVLRVTACILMDEFGPKKETTSSWAESTGVEIRPELAVDALETESVYYKSKAVPVGNEPETNQEGEEPERVSNCHEPMTVPVGDGPNTEQSTDTPQTQHTNERSWYNPLKLLKLALYDAPTSVIKKVFYFFRGVVQKILGCFS
ncbi:uncharacterized protein LOC144107602 [Amblyomma americanum]